MYSQLALLACWTKSAVHQWHALGCWARSGWLLGGTYSGCSAGAVVAKLVEWLWLSNSVLTQSHSSRLLCV